MNNKNNSSEKKDTHSVEKKQHHTIKNLIAGKSSFEKCALLVSLLTLMVVLIFFYALNQNMNGMNKKIQILSTHKPQTESFSTELNKLAGRMANLEEKMNHHSENTDSMYYPIRNHILKQIILQLQYIINLEEKKTTKDNLLEAIALIKKAAQQEQTNKSAKEVAPIQ